MLTISKNQSFNCITDYALETLNFVDLAQLSFFFENLPGDPYLENLEEKYRFRRLSRFKVTANSLVKLPHACLFQSKKYNPLLGDVIREYEELDTRLSELDDFQNILLEFFEFCKLCSTSNEIAVHQIRTVASVGQIGKPAPEGIHRDGVDLVGIFCVQRKGIEGAETHLYKEKNGSPIFRKILNPGELLVFSDSQFFHFTSPIEATGSVEGVRDVFVLTCPGLLPPNETN